MGKLWPDKVEFWTLAGILVIALGLRVWALKWGLPYLYDHDETQLVLRIQHIFETGDLNPHQFAYGSLFFYINALAYIPYFLIGWAIWAWKGILFSGTALSSRLKMGPCRCWDLLACYMRF